MSDELQLNPTALGAARQAHRLEFHKDKHTSWAAAFDAAVVAGVRAYLTACSASQVADVTKELVSCTCHDDVSRRLCLKKRECVTITAHGEQG